MFKVASKFKLLILSISCFYCSSVSSTEVLILAPGNSAYWTSVYEPMIPTAKQLGLNLSILRPSWEERFDFVPALKRYLESNKKPDWVIWAPRSNSPTNMLSLLEKHNIYSINISNPIVENYQVGQPMDIYDYWKAEISSSNYIGTYQLLSKLVKRAYQYHSRPPFSLVAITGNQLLKSAQKVSSSIDAVSGEIRNLRLLQMVHTDWSRKSASDKTEKLLKRHHYIRKTKGADKAANVDLIWAGNIDLALGVVDAVDAFSASNHDYQKPLVVSQGWHPDIFDQIEANKIEMSIGGNHLCGVWALIVIYDQINGIKLDKHSLDKILVLDKFIVSDENVNAIRKIFEKSYWQKINIKKFSKTHNKKLEHYNFGVEQLLLTP